MLLGNTPNIKFLPYLPTALRLNHFDGKALNEDAFYGVRERASGALRDIGTDEAFAALRESIDQADARVRMQVVEDMSGFYRPETFGALVKIAGGEKNPDIRATAIRQLGKFNSKETKQLLARALDTESFGDRIADAAVSAIGTMDDPYFIGILRKHITNRAEACTTRSHGNALETLGHISRNEKNKTKIRKFLTGFVNHKNRRITASAINALGALGDPKAVALLAAFEDDDSRKRIQRAAGRALTKLRQQKPLAPGEVIELRKILDDVKKDNEKLRKEFEDLKKRLDAKDDPPSPPGPPGEPKQKL